VLDDGKLVVAHAGMKESMQGRASRAVVRFLPLYGETTGETTKVWLADPLQLGGRVSRSGDGHLWSNARADTGVA